MEKSHSSVLEEHSGAPSCMQEINLSEEEPGMESIAIEKLSSDSTASGIVGRFAGWQVVLQRKQMMFPLCWKEGGDQQVPRQERGR